MKEYGEFGETVGKHVLDCNGDPIYAGSYVRMTYTNKTKQVAQVFAEGEDFELENGTVINERKSGKSEKILYQDGGWDRATSVYVVNGTMSDALGAISCLEREKKRLKAENEQLEAEIERLKDEISGDYMRLPLDADGVPIRLGDEVWYVGIDAEITKDDPLKVVGLVSVFNAVGTYIMTRDYPDKAIAPHLLTHKPPEPSDSWEKLEEDALKGPCTYFGMIEERRVGCENCPHSIQTTGRICRDNMQTELIERAKRLAGIEDQEGK